MTTTTIKIDGMTCMGCVRNITGVLTAITGVSACDVSKEQGQAVIEFDANRVTETQLKEAIENAGFDVI